MKPISRVFQTQTAMIRTVVRVNCYNKEICDASVVSTEVFPLGFTFCVDSKDNHYQTIKEEIKKNPSKLLKETMFVEPGLYEIVCEYRGRIETSTEGDPLDTIWKVFNVHMYQLTEEDQKEFGVA